MTLAGPRSRGTRWRSGVEEAQPAEQRIAGTPPARVPMSITQPSTTRDPSIRLEREEARVAAGQHSAAARARRGSRSRREVCVRGCGAASRWPDGDLCYHPPSRPALTPCRVRPQTHNSEVRPLAKTPRTWTGARTPSGLKRVRQAESRHEVLQPRRSAAKTIRREGPDRRRDPGRSPVIAAAALIERSAPSTARPRPAPSTRTQPRVASRA